MNNHMEHELLEVLEIQTTRVPNVNATHNLPPLKQTRFDVSVALFASYSIMDEH